VAAAKVAATAVAQKAIQAGLKARKKYINMDIVRRTIVSSLSSHSHGHTVSLPKNMLVQVAKTSVTTARSLTEHVALVRDTALVGKNKNKTLLLICDAAPSHGTAEFRLWCYNNRVTLLYIPVKATKVLQPLDITIFRLYRDALRKFYQMYTRELAAKIKKEKAAAAGGSTADSIMLRVRATLYGLSLTRAHSVIDGFRMMLGLTQDQL